MNSRFRIAAENKIGRGPWSEWSYSINTDEEAPEGKPQQLKTAKRNETSLLVRRGSGRVNFGDRMMTKAFDNDYHGSVF